ncbi:GRF1-interacting factor 1 [Senna tora]|uniref:GRF1-interacting factor 1 n=1 Tax=Senna tora TaxID=362788 RepID=A0A834TAQ2_9FABA|nr:GRF1-interacting factor 1 [Senna tora]
MQQHLMQMQPMMAAYYPSNVTTDHIQQYLDENKSLILKIVESQNSGKLSECAENQARLQRNLMYLAAIADSQPQAQAPTMPGQYSGSAAMQQQQQQQAHYIQQQQLVSARSSLLYAQQPFSPLAPQHQPFHGITSTSTTPPPPFPLLHSQPTHLGPTFPDFVRQGKQETATSAEAAGEILYLKAADD